MINITRRNLQYPYKIDDLPYFSADNHYLSVATILVLFDREVDPCMVRLESSMIDKSAINPLQMLSIGTKKKKDQMFYYSPTRLDWYKIQVPSLSDSVLTLSLSETDKNLKIKRIEIQLQVIDARLHPDL